MYIEPNSTIKIYSNIPLDNTYEHTLWFNGISAQNSYFHGGGNVKYSLTAQSYQRVNKGKMRIGIKADNLYDCNYLAFQNTNFGTKWFYAFINSVEYINNETSEIVFEIDCMQTYFWDVSLKQCFVERMHSATDDIGDNILPEPVELGEYEVSGYERLMNLDQMAVIVAITDANLSIGDLYDGVFGGLDLTAYRATDTVSIRNQINNYTANPEQVVSIYTCPEWCVVGTGGAIPHGGMHLPYATNGAKDSITLPSVTSEAQDFDGYTPRNKKLYTYPYNFLRIDNANGESLNLRYELFRNLTPVLEITSNVTQPIQVVARPCYYKGLTTDGAHYPPVAMSSKSECITLGNFPQCSWSNNAYKQWVSQKVIPLILGGVATIGLGGAVKGIGGAALGATGALFNAMGSSYEASIKADTCRGAISDASVNVAHGYQNFYKGRCHITKDYAMAIDSFFDRYGYACNKIMHPSRHARQHWTYVKTRGACAVGKAPSDDIRRICQIYDKGITFWVNPSEVGDYSYVNRLL